MNNTKLTKDIVIHQITNAFSDVKLGDGIGLWEAQAIDDYASKEEQKHARSKDEKENWKILKPEVLQKCNSSLSFFDAEGMRFHIPAFIIASIQDDDILDPVFHLSQVVDQRFILLDKKQKQAITLYLKWCLTQENYEFDFPHIKRILKTYWEK